MSKTPITHVIFDFDGLLVNTEPLYTIAVQRTVGQFGKTFTPELKAGMMGRKRAEGGAFLLRSLGLMEQLSVEEFWAQTTSVADTLFATVDAMPGAEELVRYFVSNGIHSALCTGSSSTEYALKAQRHVKWLDLIPLKVFCGDDKLVERGKPHPDAFLETMKRFRSQPVTPSSVLVFEDAPNGVESALNAGCQVVWVPDPSTPIDEDLKAQVDSILPSLGHFQPELFGLPCRC